jgi:transcription initiation factor TFIIB
MENLVLNAKVQTKSYGTSKTLKKKMKIPDTEKQRLWKIYDTDKTSSNTSTSTSTSAAAATGSFKQDVMPSSDLCPNCNSVLQSSEEGFLSCIKSKCGFILNYSLDYSPEWRFYASEQKHGNNDTTRCGAPIDPLLEESSYACKIMCNSKSSYEMKNLKKWTKWQSMPHKEKALYEEFQIITTMALNGGIPKMFIEAAKSIYKDLYEQKTFRGVKRDAIRAASIWIVCWKHGCPRTSNEIAEIFLIEKNSASLGCSLAEELLQSHERTFDKDKKSKLCSLTPSSFIQRFSSKLKLSQKLMVLASFIASQVENKNLIPDNRPQAIAVGICYFVCYHCGYDYTKTTVKAMLGDEVSEVTINKCFKKLQDHQSLLLPSWVSKEYK